MPPVDQLLLTVGRQPFVSGEEQEEMETAIAALELAVALAAFWVISKGIIGRLGELGFFKRSQIQQQP